MRTNPYRVGEVMLVIHPKYGPLAGVVEEFHEEMPKCRIKGHDRLVPIDDEYRDINFKKLWEYHQFLRDAIIRLRDGMELTMEPEEYGLSDESEAKDEPKWLTLLMRMGEDAVEGDLNLLFDAEQMEYWDAQIRRPSVYDFFDDDDEVDE